MLTEQRHGQHQGRNEVYKVIKKTKSRRGVGVVFQFFCTFAQNLAAWQQ